MSLEKNHTSRRDFVKKAAYVTPVILTLAVAPSYAKAGSVKPGKPQPVIPRRTLLDLIRRLFG